MSEFKTLANCKPSEFLKQTVKIKRAVQKWIDVTDVKEIMKRVAPNEELKREQFMKNISDVFDNALENHPQETLEILAACCFIEPEDADNHKTSDYLTALNSLVSDKSTIDFFISLARLGQIDISDVSKA